MLEETAQHLSLDVNLRPRWFGKGLLSTLLCDLNSSHPDPPVAVILSDVFCIFFYCEYQQITFIFYHHGSGSVLANLQQHVGWFGASEEEEEDNPVCHNNRHEL